jgi:hypothetical protein
MDPLSFKGSTGLHSDVVSSIVAAVTPAVTSAVKASLQERWFTDMIQASVRGYLSTSSSGSSNSRESFDSLSSGVSSNLSSSLKELDSLCVWKVPCPVCGEGTFANEKVFDEHLKLILKNQRRSCHQRVKCVLRPDKAAHVRLLQRWATGQEWEDQAVEFVCDLRALLTPGSKRVYRPGGTGNDVKVKAFLQECLSVQPHSSPCSAVYNDPHSALPSNDPFFVTDAYNDDEFL